MITREELITSKEYWTTKIQNELFALMEDYMNENNLSRSRLAAKLGVSKGYITQVLNGDFDHRLSKLVELSLMIGKAPVVNFNDLEQYYKSTGINNVGRKHTKKIAGNRTKEFLEEDALVQETVNKFFSQKQRKAKSTA